MLPQKYVFKLRKVILFDIGQYKRSEMIHWRHKTELVGKISFSVGGADRSVLPTNSDLQKYCEI